MTITAPASAPAAPAASTAKPAPSTPATSTANVLTTEKAPALNTPTGERLSIHEGLARLKAAREATKAPAETPAKAPPAAVPPKEDAPDLEAVTQEPVDTDADTEELDIDEGAQAEGGDAAPLAAPSSYSAEEREVFAALPRPAQEAALRLETSRRSTFSRDQKAASDARASAEALAQQVQAERRFLIQQAAPLLQSLQQQHVNEFQDIRGPGDITRMADLDPARYARWQAQQISIRMAEEQQRILVEQETQATKAKDREAGQIELKKLSQTVKGWDTPEGLQRGMSEVREYVLGYDGVEASDLAMFRKAPFVVMARKAKAYDAAVARRTTAPATPAARTAAPSAARVASGTAFAATNRALAQVRATGSIEDAVGVLKAQRGIRQR